MSVVNGGSSSASGGHERKNIEQYFPPGYLVMAALTGLFGIGIGWWNLRCERYEIVSTFIFLSGLGLWGYAVFGLLDWSFKF
jgi:hypothetical protein